MEPASETEIEQALSRIPKGVFIFTAAHDEARCGIIVRWVQQCSSNPPMVVLSILKGHTIAPIVRDARAFALCQLAAGDRSTIRRFQVSPSEFEAPHDPFIGMPGRVTPSGAPIVERAIASLDCQLVRHVDIDSDHELFVGHVTHAGLLSDDAPEVSSDALTLNPGIDFNPPPGSITQ